MKGDAAIYAISDLRGVTKAEEKNPFKVRTVAVYRHTSAPGFQHSAAFSQCTLIPLRRLLWVDLRSGASLRVHAAGSRRCLIPAQSTRRHSSQILMVCLAILAGATNGGNPEASAPNNESKRMSLAQAMGSAVQPDVNTFLPAFNRISGH